MRKPGLAMGPAAVVALALLMPGAQAAASGPQATTPEPLHVVVPAYWFQNIPSWSELASDNPLSSHDGQLTVSNAIMNPCAPTGGTCSPGNAVNPATKKNLMQEEAAGITFYGYVATGYDNGTVTIAAAEKKMREYHNWYGLTNIFLDEAATSCSAEKSYYLKLYTYVHATFGGKVILNPGTATNSCYMSASDMIMIFEGPPSQLSAWTPPRWMARYGQSRFIATVFGVTGPALGSTLASVGSHGFGNTYITDQTLPNPYAQLPTYWSTEAADVSGT